MATGVSYFSTNIVHVRTGIATEEQLSSSVDAFKKILIKMFPTTSYSKCEMMINYVRAKGQPVGYAYLWVSNNEVFNILCGFNPDGSERTEEIDMEKDIGSEFLKMSFREILNSIYDAPIIKRSLPPILTLPGYEYSEDQSQKAYIELVNERKSRTGDETCDISDIDVPKVGFFSCTRSRVYHNDDPTINNHKIYSEVENWITKEMIRDVFGKFNTSILKDDRVGQFIFPIITMEDHHRIPGKKKVYIEFSNQGMSAHDASFALQMTRKTKFVEKNVKGQEPREVEHVFNLFKSFGNPDKQNSVKKDTGFSTRAMNTGFSTRAIVKK